MVRLNNTDVQIIFKRGQESRINAQSTIGVAVEGEPHYTTDTKTLYIFDGTKNRQAGMKLTQSAGDPTTTELPEDGMFCIHKNTTTGKIMLAYNTGGTIKSTDLLVSSSKIYIDESTGFVGIKTTNPKYYLDIGWWNYSQNPPWWFSGYGINVARFGTPQNSSSGGILLYADTQFLITYATSGQSSWGGIYFKPYIGYTSIRSGGTDTIFLNSGNVGIGISSPTSKLDVNDNRIRIRSTFTPTSSADANGNIGDIAWDDNYIYVKTSVGWKRAPLSTW